MVSVEAAMGQDSPEPKQAEALLSAAVELDICCQTDTTLVQNNS